MKNKIVEFSEITHEAIDWYANYERR